MEPLVDIVLATYNGAAHLEAQLASLRAQTHRNWRLIAYDDGSGDASRKILTTFAAAEPRAVIIPSTGEGGTGPVAAFGAALAHSDAPYFMFCDQDDVWLPEKVATLLAALRDIERDGAPCLVHSDMRVVDADLNVIAGSFWAHRNLDPEAATPASLLLRNVVTGCAMMGNAALRDAMLPMPDAAMMHDWWAALIAAHSGRIAHVAQPTLLYRRHDRNVTGFARPGGAARELARFAAKDRFDLSKQRAYLEALQKQARALAPLVGEDSVAGEFGGLASENILRRKTFLARHGLVRRDDPLWSLAYHWII